MPTGRQTLFFLSNGAESDCQNVRTTSRLPSSQYPGACPPVLYGRPRLSRISWAPSRGYFLKEGSQLLAISEMFPSRRNFAPRAQSPSQTVIVRCGQSPWASATISPKPRAPGATGEDAPRGLHHSRCRMYRGCTEIRKATRCRFAE
jgi:hypothetical protein